MMMCVGGASPSIVSKRCQSELFILLALRSPIRRAYLCLPKLRPGLRIGGREGDGDGRTVRGAGAARGAGDDGLLLCPKLFGLWSAPGSRMEGEAYCESRYPPLLLAYGESRKPPLCAYLLPEYRFCVVVPCEPYRSEERRAGKESRSRW